MKKGTKRHGHSFRDGKRTPTYRSWQSMIARCTLASSPAFEHYKARGIKVCERWRSFPNFLADMGERSSISLTLERVDNDRGYDPGNCVWATRQQQANNRITNVHFEYEGERITFAELVRRSGKPKEFLRHRLLRAGWSVADALTVPPSQGARGYHA